MCRYPRTCRPKRFYRYNRSGDTEAYRTAAPITGEAMNVPTVLVVDNDQENLDLVEQALAGEGYKIHRVRSGPDAIGLMMSTRIDVVILDLDMPEMNGNELLLKGRWLASQQILTGSFSFLKVRAK